MHEKVLVNTTWMLVEGSDDAPALQMSSYLWVAVQESGVAQNKGDGVVSLLRVFALLHRKFRWVGSAMGIFVN